MSVPRSHRPGGYRDKMQQSDPEFCPCPQCFNCTHTEGADCVNQSQADDGICKCEKTPELVELTDKLSKFKASVLAAAEKSRRTCSNSQCSNTVAPKDGFWCRICVGNQDRLDRSQDRRLVHTTRADIARATGHRYAALERETENLSHQALSDLRRLIYNMKNQTTSERNKRRRGQFW